MQAPPIARRVPQRRRQVEDQQKWLRRPIAALLLGAPLAILFLAPTEHWGTALLAFLNTVIICGAIVHFARVQSFEALLPIFFLVWQLMQFPVGTLYFATVMPEAYYEAGTDRRYYLDDNWKVQLALLLFLAAFLPPQLLCIRRRNQSMFPEPDRGSAVAMASVCLAMAVTAIGLNVVSNLKIVPGIEYLAQGVVIYLNGLMLVFGVHFTRLPIGMRWFAVAVLTLVLGFYAMANARSQAIQPVIFLLSGILFVSRMSPRVKNLLVIGFLIFFPVFMVIGNTTRHLLGRAGGYENIAQRFEAMSRLEESFRKQPPLFATVTRLFSTGGHSIITMTPNPHSYLGFDAKDYLEELLTTTFIPGVIYSKIFYGTSFQLRRYGFYITDKTSVELSMVGALWMMDGPIAVFIGGACAGVLNALLAVMLTSMRRRAPNRALFVFAIFSPAVIFGSQYDFIAYFSKAVRSTIIGHVLYFATIAPIVREPRRTAVAPRRPLPGAYGPPPPFGFERPVSNPTGNTPLPGTAAGPTPSP